MITQKSTTALVAILIAFGAAILLQATWFRNTKSITFDETYYLSCTLQTVHDGKLDSRIGTAGMAPLPILVDYLLPLSCTGGEVRPGTWDGKPHDPQLIRWPRLVNSLLIGLGLVVLVAVWLFKRCGAMAAMLGAGLTAFSPNMVGHASLAATDAFFAMFGLLALAAIAWYFHQPTRTRFVVMAAAIGAALTAKYSALFLLPVAGVMFISQIVVFPTGEDRPPWMRRLWRITWKLAVLGVLIGFFCWAMHLFTFTGPLKKYPLEATPDSSPWVKMLGRGPVANEIMRMAHEDIWCPGPVKGILIQVLHNKEGHPAFLMGRHSETGWWYYFPCAFLMKSTPVELLVALSVLLLGIATLRAPLRAWRSGDVDLQVLFLAILVFTYLVITAKINIGHRYILIFYPLLTIIGVDWLSKRLQERPKIFAGCAAVLLVGQAISCLSVAPHYLAYFNSFVGGPERGWHYLVDSNIDWGQDLPALREELERVGCRHAAIRYFGTASLQGYGVDADPVPGLTRPVEEYDVLAISVTALQGVYAEADDPFRGFRDLQPIGRAGHSIFLYDLTRPEGQKAMQEAVDKYRQTCILFDAETDDGTPAYRIETPAAVYILEKDGVRLTSVIDPDGNDWLSFEPTPGSRAAKEQPGPQAEAPQPGESAHPKNQGIRFSSTWVAPTAPDKITIYAESEDGLWACRYEFYTTHYTFTMTRMPNDGHYSVLFQGTPGGQTDESGYWMSSAVQEPQPLTATHQGDLPAPEWFALGDRDFDRVLYVLHREDDDDTDSLHPMDQRAIVFGFGRQGGKEFLAEVPQQFTIGFLETANPEVVSREMNEKQKR